MKISIVLALAATCGFSALAYTGCGSDDSPGTNPGTDTGTGGGVCDPPKDPLEPPINCGPEGGGATKCSSTDKVKDCPSNECQYQVEQTGTTKNFRMGRIRLWSPDALLSLTSIAVDPNVNAKCQNGGTETFTWLMQVDTAGKKIKTGGARNSTDSKTFSFLAEKVDASKVEAICPGFVGPKDPVDLSPVESTITMDGDKFTTPQIAQINVPIFDSSGTPIILPLREAFIKNAEIKGSCIGKFQKEYWCDGDSLGWTTGGAIIAKITAEDADRVPVKSAGCQSLCAILVNDATKTEGKVCKRVDGKIPEIGTHCVGGGSCKNAFLLSATFGAYGVTITGTAPPMDGGTDTGGGDTGTGETSVSDSASEGG
jgi:hypothetical protein